MKSLPPGTISRIVAIVLAGVVALMLQNDLATHLANPPYPEIPAERSEAAVTILTEPETVPADAEDPVVEEAASPAEVPASPPVDEPEDPVRGETPPIEEAPPVEDAPTISAPAGLLGQSLLFAESYDEGDIGRARLAATEMVNGFESADALIAALTEVNVSDRRARLLAIRALLLSDRRDEAREAARAARLLHPDDVALEEVIRVLKLLRPRIVDLDSFVNERQKLVLKGTVLNEDIGAVRKVRVRAEALDEDGNVIASTVTRVKPKLLASNLAGQFEVRFKDLLDQERISRTRATVVEYQYEVPRSD